MMMKRIMLTIGTASLLLAGALVVSMLSPVAYGPIVIGGTECFEPQPVPFTFVGMILDTNPAVLTVEISAVYVAQRTQYE